jgi:DNA-binding CsgD family transcriptional regulator
MQRILTPREFEIAQLVALGKSNRTIAACLYVSQRTVENHLYSIYCKLDVRSRTELALLMYRSDALPLAV